MIPFRLTNVYDIHFEPAILPAKWLGGHGYISRLNLHHLLIQWVAVHLVPQG